MTPAAMPPPIAPPLDFFAGTAVPLGAPLDEIVCVAAEAEDKLAIEEEEAAARSVASNCVYLTRFRTSQWRIHARYKA